MKQEREVYPSRFYYVIGTMDAVFATCQAEFGNTNDLGTRARVHS